MDYFIVGERCATIRTLARDSLEGHWMKGFVVMFLAQIFLVTIPAVLNHLAGYAGAYVQFVFVFIIAGPVSLGVSIFCLRVARGQEAKVEQFLYGFERFGKATGVFWGLMLKLFLWFLIPLPLFFGIVVSILTENRLVTGLLVILIIPALIPVLIAFCRYSQVFFILADEPEIGVFECLRKSKTIMYGNKLKFLVLSLTYFGWLFLAALPIAIVDEFIVDNTQLMLMGVIAVSLIPRIAMFFAETYMRVGLVVFYDMVIGNLRPGTVQTTAEVLIQSGQQESTQMRGEAFKTEHEQTTSHSQFENTQMPQNTQQTAEFKEERASQDTEFLGDNVRQKEQES